MWEDHRAKRLVLNFSQPVSLWVLDNSQPVTSNIGTCILANKSSGAQADMTTTISVIDTYPS